MLVDLLTGGQRNLAVVQKDNATRHLVAGKQAAAMLADGFATAAAAAGVDVQINRVGSMLTVFFSSHPVVDLTSATASDTALFSRWFHGMLNRGVYLPCSQFEAMFVSAAHTDADLQATISAAAAAFADLRQQ